MNWTSGSYGSEVSWAIVDPTGATLSSGPTTTDGGTTTYTDTITHMLGHQRQILMMRQVHHQLLRIQRQKHILLLLQVHRVVLEQQLYC